MLSRVIARAAQDTNHSGHVSAEEKLDLIRDAKSAHPAWHILPSTSELCRIDRMSPQLRLPEAQVFLHAFSIKAS